MAKDINIGGRLHSIATGNVVAGADEILDDNLGKKQTQINAETYSLVESVNNALAELSPDQEEALGVATKANANEAKLGYYVCDTDADVAAKTIAATGYVLTTGGNIRIKMTNANTADAVTLNINNTGAKALFYNGAQANANNSWEDGEVVEVYYDGTRYQCGGRNVDDEPTAGSDNLVKSGGVYSKTPTIANSSVESDLDISDEEGNVLARFAGGHLQVKNFSSADALESIQAILSNIGFDNVPEFDEEEGYAIGDIVRYEKYVYVFTSAHEAGVWDITEVEKTVINTEHPIDVKTDNSTSDLDISDENGNVLVRFENGHVRTKNFNSADTDKVSKEVDLIIFMGQSNMAGRGISNETWPAIAPTIIENAAFEFRAVSDPTKLYPVAEPFGRNENRGGINDGTSKTGSLVTAFCNAYYEKSKKTVVAVSASKGGTSSSQWQPDGTLLPEAISRLNAAVSFLTQNDYIIKHKYMVWCQGETDGDKNISPATYKVNFDNIFSAMKSNGIEKCFIIRIGEINVSPYTKYDDIIQCQTDMCKDNEDYILISTEFAAFRSKGLMKDQFHYFQEGYNRVGQHAGANAAEYRMYGKEPVMYDVKADNLYYSKNSY